MLERLRELSKRATPGPWAAESEKSDGSYGSGEDTYEGYDTATIVTEAEIRHGSAGVLFESHNSTVGSIAEEHDDEWFRAWDEVSEANAKFIVALVNAYRSGQLHDATALAEAEARGRRQGLEEAAEVAETVYEWSPNWNGEKVHQAIANRVRLSVDATDREVG